VRLLFGECVLDLDRRELTRQGKKRPLSPKAYRLLEVLVERRPQAVPKGELRELLWPGVVAGGTTLARLVNEVRTALGDPARSPRTIRTVQRFGYAFSANAVEDKPQREGAPSPLSLLWGLTRFPLADGENLIGRTTDARICVTSTEVSRRHARILVSDDRALLEDLGSTHGTFLDGRRIDGPVELKHGDSIKIGPTQLVFCVSSAVEPPQKTSGA
jgi:DNA-binding winged helix-turn-helix (wHTH) protein